MYFGALDFLSFGLSLACYAGSIIPNCSLDYLAPALSGCRTTLQLYVLASHFGTRIEFCTNCTHYASFYP